MCCTSHQVFRSRYVTRLTTDYRTNRTLRLAAGYATGDGLAFAYTLAWAPAPVAEPVPVPEKEVVLVG